jgi:hypothetical protein
MTKRRKEEDKVVFNYLAICYTIGKRNGKYFWGILYYMRTQNTYVIDWNPVGYNKYRSAVTAAIEHNIKFRNNLRVLGYLNSLQRYILDKGFPNFDSKEIYGRYQPVIPTRMRKDE